MTKNTSEPIKFEIHSAAEIIIKQPSAYPSSGSAAEIIIVDDNGSELMCLTICAENDGGVPLNIHPPTH